MLDKESCDSMTISPIYTSEPMVTRALAAEIRHNPDQFVAFLENLTDKAFGKFIDVQAEAEERIDVKLSFITDDNTSYSVGIEAKFDHQISEDQLNRELKIVDQLFILTTDVDSVPSWANAGKFAGIKIITWKEALAQFRDSRITEQDLQSIKTSKVQVESLLNRLNIQERFSEDWKFKVVRGGSGMPSIVLDDSPALPDGRTLRGHIEVAGRGMPATTDDIYFTYLIGISVPEDTNNYFDPELSDEKPGWIEHLQILDAEVIAGREKELMISKHKPGKSKRELGKYKNALADKYLSGKTWLAKGYTDGWALGIKSKKQHISSLNEMADVFEDVLKRWFEAEISR